MNILLIHHDHVHLTLSLANPAESNPSTSISRIHTYACAPGQNPSPRGALGGAGAPMVRPHHPWLRWLPIFSCIFSILGVSQPWQCLVCFHRGRGLSSYISHPIASPLFTPSFKLSSLPPISTQSSKLSNGQPRPHLVQRLLLHLQP